MIKCFTSQEHEPRSSLLPDACISTLKQFLCCLWLLSFPSSRSVQIAYAEAVYWRLYNNLYIGSQVPQCHSCRCWCRPPWPSDCNTIHFSTSDQQQRQLANTDNDQLTLWPLYSSVTCASSKRLIIQLSLVHGLRHSFVIETLQGDPFHWFHGCAEDALIPSYPKLEDDSEHCYRRTELELLL